MTTKSVLKGKAGRFQEFTGRHEMPHATMLSWK